MTHKEIAKRLGAMLEHHKVGSFKLGEEIIKLRDELDPPRPEPGTVVWWAYANDTWRWFLGYTRTDGILSLNDPDSVRDEYVLEWDDVMWKPAYIIAPDEVAVKVPPVSECPDGAIRIDSEPY